MVPAGIDSRLPPRPAPRLPRWQALGVTSSAPPASPTTVIGCGWRAAVAAALDGDGKSPALFSPAAAPAGRLWSGRQRRRAVIRILSTVLQFFSCTFIFIFQFYKRSFHDAPCSCSPPFASLSPSSLCDWL